MARKRTASHNLAVWVALGVSCVIHVFVLVELTLLLDEPDPVDEESPDATSTPPEDLEVTMTREPPESEPEPREQERVEEREKDEEEKQEEDEKTLDREFNRKAVVQETNEEQPEEADHVSSQANKVDEETRARETNEQFSESSESSDQQQQNNDEAADQPQLGSKMATRDQKPTKPPTPESQKPPEPPEQETETAKESSETDREPTEERDPEAPKPSESDQETGEKDEQPDQPLPLPTADDIARLFDESEDREKVEEHAEKGAGHEMFKRIEDNKGAVESAMKNHISEVQPGNHTAVNAHQDIAATYVNRIHSKIHPKWGGDFLPMLDARYGPNSPLSDSSLNTILEFVVDGESGELESVNLAQSSGVTTYDMQAIAIAKEVAPHPRAPEGIRSPNGNVYLHWNFWRDQRQCGTFGVSVYKLLEDGTKEQQEVSE